MLPLYLIISDFFFQQQNIKRKKKRRKHKQLGSLGKKNVAESIFSHSLFTGEGEAVTQHAGTDVIIYLSLMRWKNHS